MLQPMSDWYWFSENRQLMLSMGKDWQCTTAYSDKQIVNLPTGQQLFSLSDTECYVTLANMLQDKLDVSNAALSHILINATAALVFHKPIPPKSWFFTEINDFGTHHGLGVLQNSFNSAVVLELTADHQWSTCMLISDSLQLNEAKYLNQFELIKVAKNRLFPALNRESAQLTA